jgi:glycosyltransferase involved in cell wall biosynthesis
VKVTEALLKGVPMIATKAGGIPLQINDGVTGFLVEIGDAQRGARHIRYVHVNLHDSGRLDLHVVDRREVSSSDEPRSELDDQRGVPHSIKRVQLALAWYTTAEGLHIGSLWEYTLL